MSDDTLFAGAPAWFTAALHEIGVREVGHSNDGPAIRRYIAMAHCGAPGEPWCAIFANAMLEQAGIHGSRSPSSQSFRHNENFVALAGPALGAVVVFYRKGKNSGQGHVGFYRGELAGNVWVLGGNEGDMVQIEAFPKLRRAWGLWGYWWPKAVAMPTVGPVLMPHGTNTHVTDPGKVT